MVQQSPLKPDADIANTFSMGAAVNALGPPLKMEIKRELANPPFSLTHPDSLDLDSTADAPARPLDFC